MRTSFILCTASTALWAVPFLSAADPSQPPPQKKRVLIVTGVDWKGHLWKETAPALRRVIEQDPRLEVRIVEDPAFLACEAVRDYDVIVLHFKNYDPVPRESRVKARLLQAVKSGTGLVVLHFACGAFEDWPEYRELVGKVWDRKNTHDPYRRFTVRIVAPDHAITRGMKDFQTTDELYICLEGERPVDLLATARSITTGKDHPMAFAFTYGQGRVFHTPLGHNVQAITGAGPAELIRRGTAWVAGLSRR
ncbi:MAG TPA: ThuA domain-containing protein [Planctomycetaceae bacterium]|nr:ThuA domain-containing protein [Planctomycetaceae bacterium]